MNPFAQAAAALEAEKVLQYIAAEALTPMAAAAILRLPVLCDPAHISRKLEHISAVRSFFEAGEDLPIDAFPELSEVFHILTVAGAVLSAEKLSHLARLAGIARRVRHFLSDAAARTPSLWELGSQLVSVKGFETEVARAIDPDQFSILDGASPALRRIRREIVGVQAEARKRLQHILQRAARQDMLQEDVITVREGRLVIMVKDEFRRKIGGIVHDQSATGQTLFMEPMETVELNNRVRQLRAQEQVEIERILAALSALAHEHREALEKNYQLLVEFDAIRAKARYAQKLACHAPVVKNDGVITLFAARHPLLLEKYHDPDQVVPLDFQLGKEVSTVVITGPNAGGKTVALKTLGLAVLLTRMGLHIPGSADCEIGLMGNIFVDIGDEQSIENDLSTFTSHMQRLRDMLAHARESDLVLIDEMGAGTDPEEGAALALAALKSFTERGVRTVATTHHGALKVFAHETPGVENASMIFDIGTLRPTYRLRMGVPGASYAFEIAKRTGIDEAFLAAARAFVGQSRGRVETLIAELERKIEAQEELRRKLALEETRLAGLATLYRERAERLAADERKLKKQALAEAEGIVQRANAALEDTVRQIKEAQASREVIKQTKERLRREKKSLQELRRQLQPAKAAESQHLDSPAAGDKIVAGSRVVWLARNTSGTVLDAPDAEGRVHIQIGAVRVRVPAGQLRLVSGKTQVHNGSVRVANVEAVRPEIDVRGKRADEALGQIDQYLNEALLSGWDEVRIVHGKGTGALRKAIQTFLKTFPAVASFGPAEYGQGDAGVTIVTFK